MRLGDLDAAKERLFSYYSCVNENTHKSNYMGDTLMSYEVADMIEDCLDGIPTIDPETLPIVRQLREENEKLKHDLSDSFTAYLLDKLNKAEMKLEALKMNPPVQLDGDTFDLACRLAKVTAERDAAVADLHKLVPAWKWDEKKED